MFSINEIRLFDKDSNSNDWIFEKWFKYTIVKLLDDKSRLVNSVKLANELLSINDIWLYDKFRDDLTFEKWFEFILVKLLIFK